jgi:hypothetical protein
MQMTFRSDPKPASVAPRLVLAGTLLVAVAGCRRDRELIQMQAEVNHAATELVLQEAEARRQWMAMQARLDEERRELAKQQRRDPIIAQAILQIGGIALCLLPLLVLLRLFKRAESGPVFHPIDETVLDELLGQVVPLLPGPDCGPDPESPSAPRLGHCRDLNALIDERMSRRDDES